MAEDSPVQSLDLSMPGTPTSTMGADSKASQSRTPEVAVGSAALSRRFKTLRRKDGLLSTKNLFPHLSTVDVDAIDGDKSSETFRSSGALTPRTLDSKKLNLFDLHQCSKPATQRSDGNTSDIVDRRDNFERLAPDDHPDCQGASEEQVVDRVSLVSLFTAPDSCIAISSPGLNTLRRSGAKISAEMGYSSQNMWDIDTDESENPLEGPTFTRARSASIDLPINRTKVRGLPVPKTTLENMALRFEDIEVSPRVTIRRSPTRSKRNMSTQSTRSALRPSIACSNRPSSIWNPEDDEFERWPGKETLDRIGNSFTLHRGTSRHNVKSGLEAAFGSTYRSEDDDSPLTEKETDYTNLSAQQYEDLIHELLDKECGNPYGSDANDELVQQFYSSSVLGLPASSPACHMHVLNWEAYMASEDDLVRNALPRLCDAVATVLYFTNPQCLEDFLNPDIETFEWRRNGHCLMIRREGNEVIVGTFHNFATNYVWTYFVRSSISSTGTWKEMFAAVASGVTFVSAKGVEFDKFESEPSAHGISPTDEKYALYMGRELAFFLLQKEVWNYRKHNVWTVQWEADGVVTIPKEHDRYQMWSIKEVDE